MSYIKTLSSTEMTGTGKYGKMSSYWPKMLFYLKNPPYLKNPENIDLKSPKNPRVF